METPFRFADIELSGSGQDERIVGLFRFESETKGRRGPSILILAEIASSLYVYEQLLDAISEAAESARHLTSAAGSDPMARFEKLIERLNDAVARFVEQEPSEIAWNRVNIFVTEFTEGRMCVAGLGRLTSILLQRQSEGSFKSYDLLGSLEQPAAVDPKKVFASLLCGDLRVGDQLFVGTNNFDRWREDLDLIGRMKTQPPVSAALEIKQSLESLALDEDFAGFIVSRSAATDAGRVGASLEEEGPKSTQSIERMYAEERKTEAMLSPSISPRTTEVKAPRAASAMGFSLVKLSAEIRSRIKKLRLRKDPISLASLRGMNAGHGSFFLDSRRRLLVMVVGGILLVGLIGGWIYSSRKFKAEQELWNAVYTQATDKKNRAEADLVYGNEDRTRRLIKEAQDLLVGLDEKTNERAAARSKLGDELKVILDKLKRETAIERPELMASLGAEAPSDAMRALAMWNGQLYAVDQAGRALLEIDPATKTVKRVDLPAEATEIVSAAGGPSSLLLVGSGKTLFQYVNGSIAALTWSATNAASPTDLVIYNKRAYLLDPSANMIWRYNLSTAGISGESAYLKQTSANMGQANGMSIDASVYVSFSDGTLKRYLSGAEETWKPVTVEPPLASAASVWAPVDTDRVAVADTAGKRIVIFRKDGRLVGQLTSPEFKGPTAVFGDPAAKKLYVIDANRLYRLDLP